MNAPGHSVWRRAGVLPGSRGRGPTVPDNIVLIMRFHPVGGDDVSVVCEDFAGEPEALEAVARALAERGSRVLVPGRDDREAPQNGPITPSAPPASVRAYQHTRPA